MECWSICLSLDRIYVSWPWFCQCSGLGWVSVRPRLCVGIDGVSLSVCLSANGICVCQSLMVSGETGYRGIRRRHSSVCLFLARKSVVQPRAMSGREDTSQAASLEVGRVKADLGSLLGRSIS